MNPKEARKAGIEGQSDPFAMCRRMRVRKYHLCGEYCLKSAIWTAWWLVQQISNFSAPTINGSVKLGVCFRKDLCLSLIPAVATNPEIFRVLLVGHNNTILLNFQFQCDDDIDLGASEVHGFCLWTSWYFLSTPINMQGALTKGRNSLIF
jgi:hypothetical protein